MMQNIDRGKEMIEFCTKSFSSCNHKVLQHASFVLFNFLLCFENSDKRSIQAQMEPAFKTLDEVINDATLTDVDTLNAILMCECRMLYNNNGMCVWLEDAFKLFFKETHDNLKARVSAAAVKESVDDVMSLVATDKE